MKILQVIPVFSSPFGGPVTVVRSISKELAKRHDVTVYTTTALDPRRDFRDSLLEVKLDGYRVVYFPRIFKSSGFNISPVMAKVLDKTLKEYDVVHLHSWRNFQDIIVHHYAKKYNVPYILQAHGSLPTIMAKQRLKRIYDQSFGHRLLMDASKLIALSSIEAEQYKCAGVPTEKIAIIPNGLELSEDDLPTKGVFRRKFGIGDDEKIILYLGRIHKIKGIDILVKAFKKVIEEVDNVKLVVVGPDDGYLRELKSEIKSLQIENKILIPGPLYGIDKLEAYVDADVYVLPSRYEIWGMTVLESIACQTPVIVTENCGTADYVRDKAGLVVQANFNQLSKALLEMLLDTEKHSIFAKNCRIVLQEFNILATVSKLEKIYEEILFCDYKAREASFNEAHA